MHLVYQPCVTHLIVHGSFDAVLRIGLLDEVPCCLQLVHRTLVHGYTGAGEPSLGLQVSSKVLQEGKDKFSVLGLLRFALHLLGAVGSTVIVIKDVMPRHQRVAIYLLIDAAVHHKLHPAVKDGVVILPRTIYLLHLGYHALKRIVGLAVPGMLYDGTGNNLLARICQKLHDGTHMVKVGLAPQGNVEITCHSIGVLPKVEVESPLRGLR